MDPGSFQVPDNSARLSDLETRLSKLFQPGRAGHEEFLRYYGAAYRYFLALVHDGEAAKELTNQFAQRFLGGDFHRFDPAQGRFRDFLKVALRHMAMDHFRAKNQGAARVLPTSALSGQEEKPDAFESAWQEELLHQTWKALEQFQDHTGKPYHTVLRFKSDHARMRSAELAAQLAGRLGKPLTAAAVRQLLHRAREAFRNLLVNEVARSLGSSNLDRLEEELLDLKLWSFCQDAVNRRR